MKIKAPNKKAFLAIFDQAMKKCERITHEMRAHGPKMVHFEVTCANLDLQMAQARLKSARFYGHRHFMK